MKPIITTERLILREWQDSDVELFVAMNSDPVVMEFFPRTFTREETLAAVERFRTFYAEHGFCFYAMETKVDGAFAGFTGLYIPRFDAFFTPCVEIGWRLRKEVWGQGLATEAAAACLDYGFNVLNLSRIVSFTATTNKRSENVMQKIGMKQVGSFCHPSVPPDSPLCEHVLYESTRPVMP